MTEHDQEIIRNWKVGDGEAMTLSGDYPITDHGRNLYTRLGWGPAGVNMEFLMNEAMSQNVDYDLSTDLFI